MNKIDKNELIRDIVLILVGGVINSLGVALFLDPYNVITGGATGIAMMINYVTGDVIGTGWIILIINVPLIIIGFFFIGRAFIVKTLISTALTSGLIELFSTFLTPLIPHIDNIILAALAGAVLFGVGVALIFRAGSSTAGTDIIVKLLRKKFRSIKTGHISMAVDLVIIFASVFAYRNIELLLVAALSVVIYTSTFNLVLYGGNSAMLVHIITAPDKVDDIKAGILKDLDIGATIIDAKGAYSGNDKAVVLCVVKNYVYPRLLDTIKKYDDAAFTIVSSAKEIYGEGYKHNGAEEL